jgi:hypothetical protein
MRNSFEEGNIPIALVVDDDLTLRRLVRASLAYFAGLEIPGENKEIALFSLAQPPKRSSKQNRVLSCKFQLETMPFMRRRKWNRRKPY